MLGIHPELNQIPHPAPQLISGQQAPVLNSLWIPARLGAQEYGNHCLGPGLYCFSPGKTEWGLYLRLHFASPERCVSKSQEPCILIAARKEHSLASLH